MATPRFLMWYDDNPKVSVGNKIEAAIAAFTHRFRGVTPNVVLVNEAEVIEYRGVQVRGVNHIRRNNFWVGVEENVSG